MTGSDHTDPGPLLRRGAGAARRAYRKAQARYRPAELAAVVGMGADGTATMRIDRLVEEAVLAALAPAGFNVLSEEAGFLDRGSARTVVVDPVDGSANAAAGVPLACFSAAVAEEGRFTHALTAWLHTGEWWWATAGEARGATSGRRELAGAAVSLLRPHAHNQEAWWRVAERSARIRVLSCSTLEAVLVATGATDAFVDAGSDTHRLVDLAAAVVLVGAAGGVVTDVFGRPVEFDTDLSRRWSGIVAATPTLAEELAEVVRAAAAPGPVAAGPVART